MFMDIDLSKPMKLVIKEPTEHIVTLQEAKAMLAQKPSCPLCDAGVPKNTV